MLFVLWSKWFCCSLPGFSNLIHTLGFVQRRYLLWASRALSCSHRDERCPEKPWVAWPAPAAPHALSAVQPQPRPRKVRPSAVSAAVATCVFHLSVPCCAAELRAPSPSPGAQSGSGSQSDLQLGDRGFVVEMKTRWLLLEHHVSCALFFASDKWQHYRYFLLRLPSHPSVCVVCVLAAFHGLAIETITADLPPNPPCAAGGAEAGTGEQGGP